MDEVIKQATNVGIFSVAFFVLLRYFLQRMEKQIEKGEQREVKLQEVITENQIIIKDNQEIMRKQADSIGEIKEIKAILKIKGDVE